MSHQTQYGSVFILSVNTLAIFSAVIFCLLVPVSAAFYLLSFLKFVFQVLLSNSNCKCILTTIKIPCNTTLTYIWM